VLAPAVRERRAKPVEEASEPLGYCSNRQRMASRV
jgi:hypothetical protein